MFQKLLITVTTLFMLGACTIEVVEKMDAAEIRVIDVAVGYSDTDYIQRRLDSLELDVTPSQLASDLTVALRRELVGRSRPGNRPVNVTVDVTDISLWSTVPGLLQPGFAPAFSQITAVVRSKDARTGELLLQRGFLGDDDEGEATFGDVFKSGFSGGKPKQQAYRDVVEGFAADLRRVLFTPQSDDTAS